MNPPANLQEPHSCVQGEMACVKIRYLIIFMVFLAFALDSASRSSMSITIIAMVNNTIRPHNDSTMGNVTEEVLLPLPIFVEYHGSSRDIFSKENSFLQHKF